MIRAAVLGSRARAAVLGVAAHLVILVTGPRGGAASESGSGALSVTLGAGTKTADALSQGDSRPQSHGAPVAHADLSYVFLKGWSVSLGGELGGAWVDFSGPATTGRVEDVEWGIRGGIERLFPVHTGTVASLGLGAEYGEARSWLHDLPYGLREEGPRNFLGGGYARAGLSHSIATRLDLYGELRQSVYHGHAKAPPLGTKFNWMGRGAGGLFGVRVIVLRGHDD